MDPGPGELRRPLHQFDGIVLATTPRTEGGPPIWVGGNTDAALRRALRRGDGWHGFEVYPEDMPDVNERLARIGAEVGRDPAELDAERRPRADPARARGGVLRARPADAGRIGGRRSWTSWAHTPSTGVDDVVIQVSLLAPLVPEALEWVAAEVLPQLPRLTRSTLAAVDRLAPPA